MDIKTCQQCRRRPNRSILITATNYTFSSFCALCLGILLERGWHGTDRINALLDIKQHFELYPEEALEE